MLLLRLLLLLLWSSAAAVTARASWTYRPVNWSAVSSTAIAEAEAALSAPIGCSCLDTSSSADCAAFVCTCGCDLTAGMCDPFCCCDTECTSEQTEVMVRQGLCSVASSTLPAIEYCSADLSSSAQASAQVNPLVVDSVVCVAVDNAEAVGGFFSSPPEEQMAVTNAFLQNPKPLSFATSLTTDTSRDLLQEIEATSTDKVSYEPGDLLKIFSRSGNDTVHAPVLAGFGPSPLSSNCIQGHAVRFEFDQDSTTCVQSSVDMETDCLASDSPFAAAPFVESVLVAKRPNASSTSDEPDAFLGIEFDLEEYDSATDTFAALDASSSDVRALQMAEAGVVSLAAALQRPSISVNASTGIRTCSGVLLSLGYTIIHNGFGVIERVHAKIVVSDVALPSTNSNLSTSVSLGAQVRQTFSVKFESSAKLAEHQVSLVNGNVQTYERSGNPGYLQHYPVRVGVVETNSSFSNVQAISEMETGLQLPGLGECVVDTTSSTEFSSLPPLAVNFGEDSQASCSLSVSAEEFEAFCTRSDPLIDALRVNFTHVARFGNSDPLLINGWVELDYSTPDKNSAIFQDSSADSPGMLELQCQDLITSTHLEFLVATVGSVGNPQHKIIAARASHSKETWRFWKTGSDSRRAYLLHTSVSFVYIPAAIDQLAPETPPLWFSIPSEVFYPFTLNSSPSSQCSKSAVLLTLVCLVFISFND